MSFAHSMTGFMLLEKDLEKHDNLLNANKDPSISRNTSCPNSTIVNVYNNLQLNRVLRLCCR